MDNTEYMRSLEERIERLEQIIHNIKWEHGENITFSDCQIQAIALSKCKGVSVTDTTVKGLCVAALTTTVKDSTIQSCNMQGRKTQLTNCTINNSEDNR